MAFPTHRPGEMSLYYMPREIIADIFIEWTILEWSAATIARQICHYFKTIIDSTPRVWSKLFLPLHSPATAGDVRAWLKRARAVPKEIHLETEYIPVILAALESAKDATSLIYRIPIDRDIPPAEEEKIRLPMHLSQLRHLHLDTSSIHDYIGRGNIFGLYNSSIDAHFSCLTILRLLSVDLTNFHIMPGLFPVMRHLVLYIVCGPILDLIQVCSGTLEDLRVTMYFSRDQQLSPHDRICLPNLKVLMVNDSPGIVSNLEAPTLRLIYANLDEVDGGTRPFPSVVEWVTRKCPSRFLDITGHLNNMPQLHHLMLLRHIRTLELCFKSLRDTPTICPHLQSIEVVEVVDTDPTFRLGNGFKAVLEECVAQRSQEVPGFTLRFVEDHVQLKRFTQYHSGDVCSFIFIRRCSSYHVSRNTFTRSKAQ